MIDYDPLLGSDLSFYWSGSYILYKDPIAGYLPVSFHQTVQVGLEGRNVKDMPASARVQLAVPSTNRKNNLREALGLEAGRFLKEKIVSVHPALLFERNEDFITYRPSGGYVPMSQDSVVFLSVHPRHNRFKGIGHSSFDVSYATDAESPYATASLLTGLCIRLDGLIKASRSKAISAAKGECVYAYLNPRAIITGGQVWVAGSPVATVDESLKVKSDNTYTRKAVQQYIDSLEDK